MSERKESESQYEPYDLYEHRTPPKPVSYNHFFNNFYEILYKIHYCSQVFRHCGVFTAPVCEFYIKT
jgi:hypothetical protein